MKTPALIFCISSLMVALTGCSGTTADRLLEEQITLLYELADAFDNDAPQAKIDEISKLLADNHRQLDDLKLPERTKKKLVADHQSSLNPALLRLAKSEAEHKKRNRSQ